MNRTETRSVDDMDGMDEIIAEFVVESLDNLDTLDVELVQLEEAPTSNDLLASIFRNLHTLKGSAGFLAFSHLETLAHAAETMLSELREGRISLSTEIMDGLLAAIDNIRKMLDLIESDGNDGDDDHAALVSLLHALTHGDTAAAQKDDSPAVAEDAQASEPEAVDSPTEEPLDTMPDTVAPESEDETPSESSTPAAAKPAHAADSSIRVDVGLLDKLMNLVGELVLARNQVLQYQTKSVDDSFHSTSQQLDLITTELQEGVMKTRMQPIGGVWSKLPRVVRDLSASCGKKVQLHMVGAETELDKTLIEAIKDPLTHIVRNSIDHGIEAPDVRTALGKPEVGTLTLRALHEGGQVIVEITDDGAGLDLDRIRSKAVSNGLVTAERAAQLNERDASMLIFQPGFSTAASVTNVSGRGVGMDVVKTNVEKIGGSLDVRSTPGEGMTLTLKIPLTLAIIPALVVSSDRDRFLIPQINLVEVLWIDEGSPGPRVELAGDAEVLRLRGELLPIVNLRRALGLREIDDEQAARLAELHGSDGFSIVVLQADGFKFGLVVDEINDTEEIVVKPLSPHIKYLGAYAGTTIMGDGAVSLILDVTGIAALGGAAKPADSAGEDPAELEARDERRNPTQTVLVCDVGGQRIGFPLALISRLEEFEWTAIERAGGRDVIQYEDRILRLIHVRAELGLGLATQERDTFTVLVHEHQGSLHGFVVDDIVDVFEADLSNGEPSLKPGLSVSGIIGRRVTDLLDIDHMIASVNAPPAATSGVAA